MKLKDLRIGLAITGSFCNFSHIENLINNLKKEGANVIPIVSYSTKNFDTRFYKKEEFLEMLRKTTGNNLIDSIVKAEPVGPKNMVDIILICPCTGNTLAKIANAVTDTPVTMAVKSYLICWQDFL